MPTGITAPIYDGDEISRDEFLMRVARMYGLAIMQREEDPTNAVRRDDPTSDFKYNEDHIKTAEDKLAELATLTTAEAGKKAEAKYEAELKSWEKERNNRLGMRGRYEDMIAKVEAWNPDSKIAYIKKGALEQLRESMTFDVGEHGKEMKYRTYPRLKSGAEWIQDEKSRAEQEITYNKERMTERQKLADERNEAIDALYESLDLVASS